MASVCKLLFGILLFLYISISDAGKRGANKVLIDSSDSEHHPDAASSVAPPRRPRGGLRQRNLDGGDGGAGDDAQAKAQRILNPHEQTLKTDWGKGLISSVQVQRYAESAMRAGAEGMERMARIGSYGEHGQNLYRDLCNLFGHPVGAPPIDWVEVPTTAGRKTPVPFIFPHKFFQRLYAERGDLWIDRIIGGAGACSEFWEGMADTEFVKRHPHLPMHARDRIVPLGFHGDGGAFCAHDSLYGLSWNSLVCRGSTIQTRFLFSVMRKSDMVADSLDSLLRIFSWSCNVLLSGQTPHLDWLRRPLEGGGVDLAGGWRAQLCQVRGDWQFYCQIFYFPQWNQADVMCPFCRASSTDRTRPWTDFSMGAAWRGMCFTHESYLEYLGRNGFARPLLFSIIGFRLECVMVDPLHTVDLGLAQHIVANVIWYVAILLNAFGGATYAERIKRCAEHLKRWYSRTRCDSKLQGKLTQERVRADGEWPKLRAKGANTRKLARYALDLMLQFGDVNSLDDFRKAHDQLAIGVCQCLVEFYDILTSESMFLSAAAKEAMPRIGNQLMGMYQQLSVMCFRREMRMWKLSPKMHLFMHLCLYQAVMHGNPRYYTTYGDEDLVGILVGVAGGVHPSTLAISVMTKWLHCVFDALLIDPDSDPRDY